MDETTLFSCRQHQVEVRSVFFIRFQATRVTRINRVADTSTGAEQLSESIQSETADGIARIQINRPEKKNALTLQMYRDMTQAIAEAEANGAVRVHLISGTDDCFTSGNDLKDFMNADSTTSASPAMEFLAEISGAKKPVVAAVNGAAVGIGTTLLLHCDLVYAGEGAVFQLPFVNLGLCPEAASSFLLAKLAGHRRAAELLLLGERFGADQAREIGLINRVCPDRDVMQQALKQAAALAAKPPSALKLTKQLLKKTDAAVVAERMSEEFRHFGELLLSAEAKEAFAAFFERRQPDFSKFQ